MKSTIDTFKSYDEIPTDLRNMLVAGLSKTALSNLCMDDNTVDTGLLIVEKSPFVVDGIPFVEKPTDTKQNTRIMLRASQSVIIEPNGSHDVHTATTMLIPKSANPKITHCTIVERISKDLVPRAVVIDRGFDTENGVTLHLENSSNEQTIVGEDDFVASVRLVEVFDPGQFKADSCPSLLERYTKEEDVVVSLTDDAVWNFLDLDRIEDPKSVERYEGDAGLDLQLNSDAPLTLQRDESVEVSTGLLVRFAGEIMIEPRTGLGRKGIMPVSHRLEPYKETKMEELFVTIKNHGPETLTINGGDRFIQASFLVPDSDSVAIGGVQDYTTIPAPDGDRKTGSYGSTGK